MPGILGLISNTSATMELDVCLAAVRHFDWYRSSEFHPAPNVSFGAVYRKQSVVDIDYFEEDNSGICVLLFGFVLEALPSPRRLSAEHLFQAFKSKGFGDWDRFDGSFTCAIYDRRLSKLHLISDRLGTLPLYYGKSSESFAFAPEAKGILARPEFTPSFDMKSVATFLTAGYCLGSRTLFDGISVMRPASVLTVDTTTLAIETQQYWNLKYERRRELENDANAESALYHALIESHSVITCDDPQCTAILLSGGWDSRGMLAFMKKAGRHFDSALTWGYRDDIPLSDATVARELASRYHIPFQFTSYSTDTFVDNAESWCYISELANDNFGWYAEGAGVLANAYDKSVQGLFVGDEIWGWGNDVANEDEMRAEVLPPHLPETVGSLLKQNIVASATESYDTAINDIMRGCDSDCLNDRKDYLYLYGRVARFIFSIGYYKEHAIPIRRPFLSSGVIDVISGLSPSQRINKRLYRSMLRHFAPEVAEVPLAHVNSLPDWDYDLRNKAQLRDYLIGLLDAQLLLAGPLSDILDINAVVELQRHEFFRSMKPVRRTPNRTRQLVGDVLRSGPIGHLLKRKLRPITKSHPAASAFNVLQRVALLSLLAQTFPRLDRPLVVSK